ncbi:hypothetical protein E308F_29780 [Moorella sp. E308F]|uniref:hypothetical protein n=1 Tax=Moorella sp. E308F TaxID=2572682 RepID=UPI0010FFADDE|nr:hypothetical protein [Moorella sp. E308F]GEA16732.1 hypothetical protein E308F_29780 [Moorella sp. E308F]
MGRKRMDLNEFREFGFLQEVNRQFFHPLGLALEVVIEEDGTTRLGGIWDCREDPEGILFTDGVLDKEKADRVEKLKKEKASIRKERFGYVIQPINE